MIPGLDMADVPRECSLPPSVYGPRSAPGMYPRGGVLDRAGQLLAAGGTNREVVRRTGMHSTTVAKLRHVLEAERGAPFLCACGRAATHMGWCRPRFAQSECRQAIMLEMRRRRHARRAA